MRAAPPLLVVAVSLVTGACSLVGRSAPCPGPLRFYLTRSVFQGNQVLSACEHGFHAASRFEVASLSNLIYDSKLGVVSDDSGAGPPSAAARYASPGPSGWIRTGGDARYSEGTDAAGSASANCAVWSSSSHDAYGTVAYLKDRFAIENGAPALWDGGAERCDTFHPVWCVAEFASRESEEPERRSGRNRRHRDDSLVP
jgi:hypothetical protein